MTKAQTLAGLKRAAGAVGTATRELSTARAKRDDWVRRALDSGHSVRQVASASGLSPQQVQNIRNADPSGTRYLKEG